MTDSIAKYKADAAISEGDRHLYRLDMAYSKLEKLFPLGKICGACILVPVSIISKN